MSHKNIVRRMVAWIMASLFLLGISLACFDVVIPFLVGFFLLIYVKHFTKNWPTNEAFPNTNPIALDISVLCMFGLTAGWHMICQGSWFVTFSGFPYLVLIFSELGVALSYLLSKVLDQKIEQSGKSSTRLKGQPLDTPTRIGG